VAEITRPAARATGATARRIRTGVYRTIRNAGLRPFRAARREALPAAYLLPSRFGDLAALLRARASGSSDCASPWSGTAERFTVDTLVLQELFRGAPAGRSRGGTGARAPRSRRRPAWFLVRRPAAGCAGRIPAGARFGRRPRDLEPARPRAAAARRVSHRARPCAARGGRRRAAQPVNRRGDDMLEPGDQPPPFHAPGPVRQAGLAQGLPRGAT